MPIVPVILQDAIVVEAKILGKFPRVEEAEVFGIVSGLGFSGGGGNEDDAEGMLAGITGGIGVDLELFN